MEDLLLKTRYENEDLMKMKVVWFQEEEFNKHQYSLRPLEIRLQESEDQRKGLIQKNVELIKQILQKEQEIREGSLAAENTIVQLKLELCEQQNQHA